MPELPEVEVLARYLDSALCGKTIRAVVIHRPKSTRPTRAQSMRGKLVGARFKGVTRRAKYLLFKMKPPEREPFMLLGHLGMTGRMYLQPAKTELPKHTAVSFGLGRHTFVFEDTRYFGRMTLDKSPLENLGPEPLSAAFSGSTLRESLRRTTQVIKPKLLDQSLLAGVGNIYASEALFRARISPRKAARRLTRVQCDALAHIARGEINPYDLSPENRRLLIDEAAARANPTSEYLIELFKTEITPLTMSELGVPSRELLLDGGTPPRLQATCFEDFYRRLDCFSGGLLEELKDIKKLEK